jgi:hypothetical protein
MKTATVRFKVYPTSDLTLHASSLVPTPHASRLVQMGALYVSR